MKKLLSLILVCIMLIPTIVIYANDGEFESQEIVFGLEFDNLSVKDLNQHFSSMTVANGNLVLKYAMSNPMFQTNTDFTVTVSEDMIFEVRMCSKNKPLSHFKVYYLTPSSGPNWSEDRAFVLTDVLESDEMGVYRLEFSHVSTMIGEKITAMRIDLYDFGNAAENEVLIDYIRFCKNVSTVSENSAMIKYDFQKNSEEDGWDISDNAQNVYISNGAIGGETTSTVYMETCAELNINAKDIVGVSLKLKNQTADTSAKLYYTTSSSNEYTEDNCFEFTINPNDSTYTQYYINTEEKPSWRENIKRLRFAFASSGGSFAVDEIILFKFPCTITTSGTNITVAGNIPDCEFMPVFVTVEDTTDGSLIMNNSQQIALAGGALNFSFTSEDTSAVIPYKISIETIHGIVFSKTYVYFGANFDTLFVSELNTAKTNEDGYELYNLVKNNYLYIENSTSEYLDTFVYEDKYKEYFITAMLNSDDFTTLDLLGERIDECIILSWLLNEDVKHKADTDVVFEQFKNRGEYKYYNALDDSTKAECMMATMAENPYTYNSLYDSLAEQSILITLSVTTGWETVQEIVETYAEVIGIDRSKVNSLKNKELVYLNMVGAGNGTNYTSYSQLVEAFNNADNAVNPTSSGIVGGTQGGRPSSSGSSGGGAFASNKAVNTNVNNDATYMYPEEEIKKEQESAFSDMEGYEWALEGVENLRLAGIINGRENGMYVPSGLVTREEFVKMLVLATGKKGDALLSFNDVQSGMWYEEYIKSAVANGYITGISANEFGVGTNITRQDVCVIVARVLDAEIGDKGETWETTFVDTEVISDYAKDAVKKLNNVGLITGADGFFRPLSSLTRAEAAVIIDRMMKFSDTI